MRSDPGGVVLLGAAAAALFEGAVVVAAVLAWPLAYIIIAIAYCSRPDRRGPSTQYSIELGREAGGDRGQGQPP